MRNISVSRKEWKILQDTAEKDYHFELCKDGEHVKPVKGKYNEENPKHIKVSDVIKVNDL